MDIANEVKLVIAKALKLPAEQLSDDTNLQDLGVESVDIIEIIFELEEKFDIALTVKMGNDLGEGSDRAPGQLKMEDFAAVGDVCRAVKAIVDAKASR
jgi:acyl carrier protein